MLSPHVLAISVVCLFVTACGGGGPNSTNSSPPRADSGNTKVVLEALPIADHRPMTGYSRARFPHWRKAGANCDVRDTVLARDGKDVKVDGCNVTAGQWVSVYDKATVADPAGMDIDHMVPLANAWRTSADSWTDEKRSDFANDLERPQLIAVTASSNRSKGDQDPSQWKPSNKDYWCQYAKDWILVKSYWQLTVTRAEKDALAQMLGTCL